MRRASVVWLVLAVAVAATTYAIAQQRDYIRDFDVYRTAAARAVEAAPLYRVDDGAYQYKYWPAFAFAMVPFAALPAEIGKPIWFVLSIVFLVLLFRLAISTLPDRQSTVGFLAGWTIVLTGKFIIRELVNGQTNTLLAVLVLCALVAAREGRRAFAGALIGLAVFVKPYALVILPWILATQGLAGATSAAGVLAAGLLLPAVVYGWDGNLGLLSEWYRTVSSTTADTLSVRENISLASAWTKWIGPGTPAAVLTTMSSVLALGLSVLVFLRRRHVAHPAYLEVGLLLLLVPLLSPQGWDYVLVIATPAIVLLVDRFRARPAVWKAVTVAGFALTSFFIYDLLGRPLYFALAGVSVTTIGAALLVAAVAHLRLRALA